MPASVQGLDTTIQMKNEIDTLRTMLWLIQALAGVLTSALIVSLAAWMLFSGQLNAPTISSIVIFLGGCSSAYFFSVKARKLIELKRNNKNTSIFLQDAYGPAIFVWCTSFALLGYCAYLLAEI